MMVWKSQCVILEKKNTFLSDTILKCLHTGHRIILMKLVIGLCPILVQLVVMALVSELTSSIDDGLWWSMYNVSVPCAKL